MPAGCGLGVCPSSENLCLQSHVAAYIMQGWGAIHGGQGPGASRSPVSSEVVGEAAEKLPQGKSLSPESDFTALTSPVHTVTLLLSPCLRMVPFLC